MMLYLLVINYPNAPSHVDMKTSYCLGKDHYWNDLNLIFVRMIRCETT